MGEVRTPVRWAVVLVGIVTVLAIPPVALLMLSAAGHSLPLWWLTLATPIVLVVTAWVARSRPKSPTRATEAAHPHWKNNIQTRYLRMLASQALDYSHRIDHAVARFVASPMQSRVRQLAERVQVWASQAGGLAAQLDACLRALAVEGEIKQDVRLLHDAAIEHAELQLELSLAQLGAVYSRLLMLSAREVDGSKFYGLQQQVEAQILSLEQALALLDGCCAREIERG
ncbi:MAG: hypothetical protein ACK4WM_10635 [Thermoflexales bacterium]